MGTARARAFTCPFYRRDAEKAVYGEACSIHAPTKAAMDEYIRRYCAGDAASWRRCTVARMLLEHYEREG